jgi:hypothetical protein
MEGNVSIKYGGINSSRENKSRINMYRSNEIIEGEHERERERERKCKDLSLVILNLKLEKVGFVGPGKLVERLRLL